MLKKKKTKETRKKNYKEKKQKKQKNKNNITIKQERIREKKTKKQKNKETTKQEKKMRPMGKIALVRGEIVAAGNINICARERRVRDSGTKDKKILKWLLPALQVFQRRWQAVANTSVCSKTT